ncbi:MAG TPA: AI-2E family transporter [Candidatus Pacearchaeota archaeon]|nr:AI-2E family transporter [Candidatus Pacearchaeota archaeon]HPR79867.1 AI-2E family transporter [Candidatus Pacearchaeota archaeon]
MKKEIEMIDITWRTIFKIIAAIILFWIVYLLRDIIIWSIIALFISVLFDPLIDILEKRKIKRFLAAIIVYFSFLLICGFIVFIIVPPLITETQYFSSTFSQYFDRVPTFLNKIGLDSLNGIYSLDSSLKQSLINISSNIFNIFISLFGSIFAGLTVFVLAIFMSIEEKDILKGLKLVSPRGFEEQVLERWERSQHHVVAWFGSRILCCFFVFIMTFLLCLFLKIKFLLALAILAGILNIIPMIGPIISGIVIAALAFSISLPTLIVALFFLVLIQQIESNILMPVFTKKMSGLPAVLVLISILIGASLGGVIGAVLAIPIAGIIFEGLKDYFNHRKEQD